MSVSDPLLKQLKVHIYQLRSVQDPVNDDNTSLQALCEILENILRKGLRQGNSIFGLSRRDYWQWAEHIADPNKSDNGGHPSFSMAVQLAKDSKQVMTPQGRGRLFMRAALQNRGLGHAIQQLTRHRKGVGAWYDPDLSIIGDDILREIFSSLLYEVNVIKFDLNIKNCAFLDQTWKMPIYMEHEFVPTKDLGFQIQHCDTRIIVTNLDRGGVAYETGKFEVGDVLDTLQGEPLRYIQRGRIRSLLRQSRRTPIRLTCTKCKMSDGSVFPPIAELLKHARSEDDFTDASDLKMLPGQQPTHALLPDDELEQLPVHNSEDKAKYEMKYVGKAEIGSNGGVSNIESAIGRVLVEHNPEKHPELMEDVSMELGETDVIVTDLGTNEVLYKHSYTEISACGRRVDMVQYIAYLAGETTCTLSKQFVAYVFKANSEEEGKTILCSIAQGFSRTHWFV